MLLGNEWTIQINTQFLQQAINTTIKTSKRIGKLMLNESYVELFQPISGFFLLRRNKW